MPVTAAGVDLSIYADVLVCAVVTGLVLTGASGVSGASFVTCASVVSAVVMSASTAKWLCRGSGAVKSSPTWGLSRHLCPAVKGTPQ